MVAPTVMAIAVAFAAIATAPPIELELAESCSDFNGAEVRKMLARELRAVSAEANAPWATRVRAVCEGVVVRFTVDDPISRKLIERSVDLSSVEPQLRARTLAVAAAELVLTSWTELVTQPEPAVEPLGTPPSQDAREQARAMAAQRLRLGSAGRLLGEVTMSVPFTGLLVLWGGGARFSWERMEVLGVEFEGRLEHGRATLETGAVQATRMTLGVSLHARTSLWRFDVRALAGLRAGAVALSGSPRTSSTLASSGVGPWLGAPIGAAAAMRFGPVSLEVALEVGIPIVGLVGLVYGEQKVRFDVPWFGMRLDVGFFF